MHTMALPQLKCDCLVDPFSSHLQCAMIYTVLSQCCSPGCWRETCLCWEESEKCSMGSKGWMTFPSVARLPLAFKVTTHLQTTRGPPLIHSHWFFQIPDHRRCQTCHRKLIVYTLAPGSCFPGEMMIKLIKPFNIKLWLDDCAPASLITQSTDNSSHPFFVFCFAGFPGNTDVYLELGSSWVSGHWVQSCKLKALLWQEATNQTIHKCLVCPDSHDLHCKLVTNNQK